MIRHICTVNLNELPMPCQQLFHSKCAKLPFTKEIIKLRMFFCLIVICIIVIVFVPVGCSAANVFCIILILKYSESSSRYHCEYIYAIIS